MVKKTNRSCVLICGVLVLLCMGLIYAWSIFVGPIEAEFGWTRTQTSLTFSISMLGFSIGGLSAGYIQKVKSPRWVVTLGAVLLLLGFIMCSQMQQLWQLFVFYGVFCGIGVGLCYNVWLGTALANYSDKTGFASGWLLMGFGLGGFILGKITSAMLYSPLGWRITFIIIGIIVFALLIVTLPFLIVMKEHSSAESAVESVRREYSPSQMLRTPAFWLYLIWCMILLGLGLAVIGQAAMFTTDTGASPAFAATAVGMLSIGNGVSRVVLGMIFDKKGRPVAALTAAVLTAGGIILLTVGYKNSLLLLVVMALFLCGFGYGAVSTVNPASTRLLFGGVNFQKNFGMIFLLSSPAIFIGNSVSSAVKTATGSYMQFLYGAVAVSIIGLFLTFSVEKALKTSRKRTSK